MSGDPLALLSRLWGDAMEYYDCEVAGPADQHGEASAL